jgi:hypothetical protein
MRDGLGVTANNIGSQVNGLMRLMESEHVGPFNLGNPGEFTMLELAEVRGYFSYLEVENTVSLICLLFLPFKSLGYQKLLLCTQILQHAQFCSA